MILHKFCAIFARFVFQMCDLFIRQSFEKYGSFIRRHIYEGLIPQLCLLEETVNGSYGQTMVKF